MKRTQAGKQGRARRRRNGGRNNGTTKNKTESKRLSGKKKKKIYCGEKDNTGWKASNERQMILHETERV